MIRQEKNKKEKMTRKELSQHKYNNADDERVKDTVHHSSCINNIFPVEDNLHDNQNKPALKQAIYGFKEVSLSFSSLNINRILKEYKITFKDAEFTLEKCGKSKPNIIDTEVERITTSYINNAESGSNDMVIAKSFIDLWKQGKINKVISYYLSIANARNKLHSITVGKKNIICNFNADNYRKLYIGVYPEDDTFDSFNYKELYMLEDNVRVFWNLYMLLVFYHICKINKDNEVSFFHTFRDIVNLALISGFKTFAQLDLSCDYGTLYQELRGVKPIDQKYIVVEDITSKQLLCFKIKNSDFLTEAYKDLYFGAMPIPDNILQKNNLKNDKHIDIQLWLKKGTKDKSMWLETVFSGQHPIGRVYNSLTDPDTVINFKNIFEYCPQVLNPTAYLLHRIIRYSKDFHKTSYYTEIKEYLKQYKGKSKRGFLPKILNVILEILYNKSSEAEFEATLNKYYKETDTKQKSEIKGIYKELKALLKPKEVRAIDTFIEELYKYAW